MRLCIRSFDLKIRDLKQLTKTLNAYGFSGVQLVCYKTFDDIPYALDGLNTERAQEIGHAFSASKLEVPLIGAYFNPVHSDTEKSDRCEKIFCQYIDLAAALGGTCVGSETGSFNDDSWTYNPLNRTESARRKVAETFKRLCDYAALKNINVGIEGAAGHVCYDVDVLAETAAMIDRPNLKVIFDIYNFLDESNYKDYLKILERGLETFGDNILLYHLKDCIFSGGALERRPLGQGMFDYSQILGSIKRHNKDAVLVFEGITDEDILPSLEFIKTTWDKV